MTGFGGTTRDALQIGRAAEHLVVADLLMQGWDACLSEQGMPYDVIVDVHGRLLRIQVKATLGPRNVSGLNRPPRLAYNWGVRRRGKGNSQRLSDDQCDLAALVAMDIRVVAYLPIVRCGLTVYLDPPGSAYSPKLGADGERYKKPHWPGNVTQYPLSAALCA